MESVSAVHYLLVSGAMGDKVQRVELEGRGVRKDELNWPSALYCEHGEEQP